MTSPGRPDEMLTQRDDRNLTDLLQELRVAGRLLSIRGLTTVSLAVSGAVLLVASHVEPGPAAILAAVVTAGLFGALWFLLPLTRREQAPDRPEPAGPGPAPTGGKGQL
jgi:hypothetical protein